MRVLLATHVFGMPRLALRNSSRRWWRRASPLNALAMALSVMLELNVVLFLFNLISVPPLDGAGVLSGFFPGSLGSFYERLRHEHRPSSFFGAALGLANLPVRAPSLRSGRAFTLSLKLPLVRAAEG